MKFIELNTSQPGVTVDIAVCRIISMKHINPKKAIASGLIIDPNADKEALTIVVCEHGVREAVKETPEQIKNLIASAQAQ